MRSISLFILLGLSLSSVFADSGIPYPRSNEFKLEEIKGKTYISFLKSTLKPTLDKLSDKKNGGGGGFANIGSDAYLKNKKFLAPETLLSYEGKKWNKKTRTYSAPLPAATIAKVYDTLKEIRPVSTTDSISYYKDKEEGWFNKNDMAVAISTANVNSAPFNLATLYTLTAGFGVKVKIDENNYNYHTLYKTGRTNPHQEVMSGRSFAASGARGVTDATDPEYLRDLQKYLNSNDDKRAFYRAMILALADSDGSGWKQVNSLGQAVLSDFFTVYTAEAVRHLMVNLKDGLHPWEIDLAAVTAVSSLSAKTGNVVQGGVLVKADLGAWFAPSPNNKVDGPQRSGIGITRRDRVKLQYAIHKYEMTQKDGKELIAKIQKIIGTKENANDVIQGVFEFLSNNGTPKTMGANADALAEFVADFIEMATEDAEVIEKAI